MIKSRCHKADVYVYCGNEGTSFYVCKHCDCACDVTSITENLPVHSELVSDLINVS